MVDNRIYFLKNDKQKSTEECWDVASMKQFRRKSGKDLKLSKNTSI